MTLVVAGGFSRAMNRTNLANFVQLLVSLRVRSQPEQQTHPDNLNRRHGAVPELQMVGPSLFHVTSSRSSAVIAMSMQVVCDWTLNGLISEKTFRTVRIRSNGPDDAKNR